MENSKSISPRPERREQPLLLDALPLKNYVYQKNYERLSNTPMRRGLFGKP